ncbi:MAG: sigma 54-interacting transcriptional regulator, partial [Deltaproteobacteria bacterium]|nr:sigma 54-interacting transcriptional regulator [Deltaproteobacteria bacterium]
MDIYPYDPLISSQKEIFDEREHFIKTGKILHRERLRPIIADSWERSYGFKVNSYEVNRSSILSEDEYQNKLAEFKLLIDPARPFMNNLYSTLEKSHYIVVLYSADGYHLLRTGRPTDFDITDRVKLYMGQCFREEFIGTCGFALSNRLKAPVQIVGPEHYLIPIRSFCGSYAPIENVDGSLIGVIGIVSLGYSEAHLHTLGMVTAASKAIENDLRQKDVLEKLNLYGKKLRSTIDSISDVLICTDGKGYIKEINKKAEEIFGVSEEKALGNHITNILKSSPDLRKIINKTIQKKETSFDHEVKIGTLKDSIRCIVSATPIKNPEDLDIRIVLLFKQIERIQNIVHKIHSFKASYRFEDIIGESYKIDSMKSLAQKAAQSNSNILIEGDSGTGKELLAHSIHNASPRRFDPFVIVNCSTIPLEMFESTLFGYEKGSFTGAKEEGHTGKFELADGGTIFLDEIGDLPINMQVKLLRFLDENKIEKVGGNRPFPLDVRIIAATNRNLMQEVVKESFRLDLYYRLSVLLIRIPPLVERKEDIPLLVNFFVERKSRQYGRHVKSITPEFFEVLHQHDWPGNIREL